MRSDGLIVIVLSAMALAVAWTSDAPVVRWAAVAFTCTLVAMYVWKLKRGEYN